MKLLTPLALGDLTLPNRMVMAPLTRSRHRDTVPHALAPTYYAQRASAGLIIAEATQVTPRGQGYPDTPGIHSDAQIDAWRTVTDTVHAVGGRIFLQLWHVGRISHSAYHDGALPVAPSPIAAPGKVMLPDFSMTEFETPHALTPDEIAGAVQAFRQGAANAREAGFDGVEIHGANGYLIEQFLSSGTNERTDDYGGSVPNRVRLLEEVTAAVLEEWPAERVGARLSFGQGANGATDAAPEATFGYAAERLADAGLVYLHAVRASSPLNDGDADVDAIALARRHFRGTLIANAGYDRASGDRAVQDGKADLIAYGRPFLANPDLPIRYAAQAAGLNVPLNEPDARTFYGGGPEGYTDYPLWDAVGVEEPELELA